MPEVLPSHQLAIVPEEADSPVSTMALRHARPVNVVAPAGQIMGAGAHHVAVAAADVAVVAADVAAADAADLYCPSISSENVR
jgi:hypothetical protein